MNALEVFLLVGGMAVVTYAGRALPLWLLSSRSLNPWISRWLSFVPAAILSALLAPSLLLREAGEGEMQCFFSLENHFLLAAIPSFLIAWFTRSFFGTVAVGMISVALMRAFFN